LPSSPHWAPTTTTLTGMLILFTSSETPHKHSILPRTEAVMPYKPAPRRPAPAPGFEIPFYLAFRPGIETALGGAIWEKIKREKVSRYSRSSGQVPLLN
jgi:hypothetical protein